MTETTKTTSGRTGAAKTATAKTATKAQTVATPWGRATVVERLSVPQRAGEKRFASVVELVELPGGERLVRVAYTTDGHARRGPVTLRLRDMARLRDAVGRTPELGAVLGGEGA